MISSIGVFLTAVHAVLVLGLPPGRIGDVTSSAVATGEDPRVLAVILHEESKGIPGAVGYCAEWKEDKGKMTCARADSCKSNCDRPEIWDNRLDLGMWQFRSVSWKSIKGKPIRGFSWGAWYRRNHDRSFQDLDFLDPMASRKVFVAAVTSLKQERPRLCKSRYGKQVGSWLTYYACGDRSKKYCGCKAREHRLRRAFGLGDYRVKVTRSYSHVRIGVGRPN
jgi:hypothetical protein